MRRTLEHRICSGISPLACYMVVVVMAVGNLL